MNAQKLTQGASAAIRGENRIMGMNATFSKRRKSLIVTAVAVAAAGGVAAAVIPAFAAGGARADHAGHAGGDAQGIVSRSGTAAGTGGTVLAASLRGRTRCPWWAGRPSGTRTGPPCSS